MLWLRHTRHRNSPLRARARDSSTGSERISSGLTARAGTPESQANAKAQASADAEAAVAQRHETAARHGQRPQPHPGHERMVVEADGVGARLVLFADRDIEVRYEIGADAGRRRDLFAHGVEAALALEPRDQPSAARDVEQRALGLVVRALHLLDRV